MALVPHRELQIELIKRGNASTDVISLATGETARLEERAQSIKYNGQGSGFIRTATGMQRVSNLLYILLGVAGNGSKYIDENGQVTWLRDFSKERIIKYGELVMGSIRVFVKLLLFRVPIGGNRLLWQVRDLQDG